MHLLWKYKNIFRCNFFRYLAQKRTAQLRAEKLSQKRNESCIVIQSIFRRFLARKKFAEMKRRQAAAVNIQKSWRSHVARKEFLATVQKIVKVQALVRMQSAAKKYQTSRRSAILLQAHWRGRSAQKSYQKTKKAVIILQSHARRYIIVYLPITQN